MKRSLLFLLLIDAARSEAALLIPPDEARSQILVEQGQPFLHLRDPGNHAWMLQSSTDLDNWSNGSSYRVFNGELRIPLTAAGSRHFFRLNPELATAIPATTTSALRLPSTHYNYANPNLPTQFLSIVAGADTQPASNVVTDAGATLGRILFYDKRLSANQTVSCSSCHLAEFGFSDPRPRSLGFKGELTRRNSMGLTNVRYNKRGRFFRDERAADLETLVLMPIQDPVEMGLSLDLALARISAEPFYQELFSNAFGSPGVDSQRLAKALAQFLRSIVSAKSKFDEGRESNFANFTAQELEGMNLFNSSPGNCFACHDLTQIPGVLTNNGLEFPFVDRGVGEIRGTSFDGIFRFSLLRNVALTAPYMHDGRFKTLEEVVEFYNSGIVFSSSLTKTLRDNSGTTAKRMNFTESQKAALVAFLKTLTDTSVTTDPKFSDPFRYTPE